MKDLCVYELRPVFTLFTLFTSCFLLLKALILNNTFGYIDDRKTPVSQTGVAEGGPHCRGAS